MDKVKKFFRSNWFTKDFYSYLRAKKFVYKRDKKFKFTGKYIDRSKESNILCIILAGYKEYLYDSVFERIYENMLPDMDICVITSGLYSERIVSLCEKHNWSYLSTEQNNVSLVQNAAIDFHPKAEYIFKLDEDIFITKNYFTNMLKAYEHAQGSGYVPGVLAPILPVNGYGYYRVLEKLGLLEMYAEKYEIPRYMTGPEMMVEKSPEVAEFFWGGNQIVPSIDEMNELFQAEPLEERPCPIRFSIGAILFERDLWERMGWFDVDLKSSGMGSDEVQLCKYCMLQSRPLMVSENIVAGHFSFGKQNEEMKKYYARNVEKFKGAKNETGHEGGQG